jgi:predicted phosphodiesterase
MLLIISDISGNLKNKWLVSLQLYMQSFLIQLTSDTYFNMKILHISDTHGYHNQFPDTTWEGIDVVVHSGDCSNYYDVVRNEQEVINFLNWYERVPVNYKIYVAGNHDTSIERNRITKKNFEDRGIIYLENSETVIKGVKFYGSPLTPTFGQWAFMKARDKMHDVWQAIPDDTDVLIVHGPPKGVRDLSFDRYGQLEFCGDQALLKRCLALSTTLKLMCFGHIHNMDGVYNQGVATFGHTRTVFSNAACVRDGRFDLGLTSFGNVLEVQ